MELTGYDIEEAMSVMEEMFARGFHDAITYHPKTYTNWKGVVSTRYELGWYEWIDENSAWLTEQELYLDKGETKGCIFWNESDWVIKVSFDRSTNLEMVNDGRDFDFCYRELKNYRKACDAGLGQYFAAMYQIGAIDGVEIYLQERTEANDEKFEDIFFSYAEENYYSDEETFKDEDERRSLAWSYSEDMDDDERVRAIYRDVDGEEVEKLINFIINNEINDLHCGNWGYTYSGKAVVFDYSGYD